MEKLKATKKLRKGEKGITLIALVITIIVLLILAGIALSMLTGENSVLKRATSAKQTTDESQIKEELTLAWNGVNAEGIVERWSVSEKASELQKELRKEDSSATAKASGNTIKAKYKGYEANIDTVGGSFTKFAKATSGGDTNTLTVGQAYDDTLIKIGDPFTYTGAGQTDWIVFGKDENGDVLLTTKTSVSSDAFTINYDAQHWLSFENDLNSHCAKYGNSSKGITGRSINLKDINRVTGYQEPEFTEYTFGTEMDYENGKVDYYYPSNDAAGYTTNESANPKVYKYWEKATTNLTKDQLPAGSTEKPAAKFKSDYYYYNTRNTSGLTDNTKYAVGGYTDSNSHYYPYDSYVVASRSVYVDDTDAGFVVAVVYDGGVYSDNYDLCDSDSSDAYDGSGAGSRSVRPVVVLPSDLEIQEGTGSVYELAE